MSMPALPTARDETWRYSDLKALAQAAAIDAAGPALADPAQDPEAVPPMVAFAQARSPQSGEVILQDGDRVERALLAAGHVRLKFIVAPGAQATLIEPLAGTGWLNLVLDVEVCAGARLNHIILQARAADAVTTTTHTVRLAGQAHYACSILQTGSQFGRIQLDVALQGEGAHAGLAVAQLATSGQTLETVTRFDHQVPGATSSQTMRMVAARRATASYLGKIHVARDAQHTDAAQSAKALLLDRTASANLKPELEIYADDVKCAHGATVGELDKAALFYLQSRGVSLAEAQRLLTRAFVTDVVEQVADEAARADLSARAEQWLETAVQGAGA